MSFVALVTLLILLEYFAFMMLCGKARGDSGLQAPAMTGDENFERAHRVQMNTLEQMMITLPAMWICAHFFLPLAAAILGLGFFFGRILYASAYRKDPGSRGLGMMVSFLSNIGLVACGLWGVVTQL